MVYKQATWSSLPNLRKQLCALRVNIACTISEMPCIFFTVFWHSHVKVTQKASSRKTQNTVWCCTCPHCILQNRKNFGRVISPQWLQILAWVQISSSGYPLPLCPRLLGSPAVVPPVPNPSGSLGSFPDSWLPNKATEGRFCGFHVCLLHQLSLP